MIFHSSKDGMGSIAVKVISNSILSRKEEGLFLTEMLSRIILEDMCSSETI